MERFCKPLRAEGELTSARLLRLMQAAAAEDAERRGGGQARMTERGCAWVLVKNRLSIARWPAPGEALTLTTWPIRGRLGLYPRCIELRDEGGALLLRADSLWAIMDLESRTMLPGEERGIVLAGAEEGRLVPPRRIRVPEGGARFPLSPKPEQIDENGHMNNAAYLEAAEALLPEALRGKHPREIAVDYEHELPAGCSAEVRVVTDGERVFFEGSMGERVCFRLREEFAEE